MLGNTLTLHINRDPTGAHTSDGRHTWYIVLVGQMVFFCVWNGNNSGGQTATQTQQQDQRQSQTVHTCIALKCEIFNVAARVKTDRVIKAVAKVEIKHLRLLMRRLFYGNRMKTAHYGFNTRKFMFRVRQ